VGASMGMAFFPEDGSSTQELMKCADTAMYAAKQAGKGTYRFFQSSMLEAVCVRMNLEEDLRHAIHNKELTLHYQPKVHLEDGHLTGVEALLRWPHPTRGLIMPGDFIPLAEETGLIIPLGNWVIEEVCRQLADWRRRGKMVHAAVNVSALQITKGDLCNQIRNTLNHHDLPANCLEVEITESILMDGAPPILATLEELRDLGITIAVDDFGTGYSNLGRLRQLPVDILKIDRSFVLQADQNHKDLEVVSMIIKLAKTLDLGLVAEGVESERQARLLQETGCQICQGHLYARALPVEHLEPMLGLAT